MNPSLASNSWGNSPEERVGALVMAALAVLVLWRLGRWLFTGPRLPDPWDAEVAAELEADGIKPLCHRCLGPHDAGLDFCPQCGAAIGTYTNWLPFPYLFSLGHMLRLGASGDFKRTPVTLAGFWLLGFAEYTVFAPFYWYRLYRGQREPHRTIPPDEPQETQTQTNPPPDAGCAGGTQKENHRWTPRNADSSV